MRRLLAGLLVAASLAVGPAAAAAADPCPNRADRDADYDCPLGPEFTTAALTDLAGWDQRSHWANIFHADLDGDGSDELLARGPEGVLVFRWLAGQGQWAQVEAAPILADRDDWNRGRYYWTIDHGDIDGDGAEELVVRGPRGVIVFRFAAAVNPLKGEWKQLTEFGPFPPEFASWDDPKYYMTIELTPLGAAAGKRTMQLAARGPGGYEVWRWNGSAWARLTELRALSDANGFGDPRYYSTIQAWDRELLLVRAPEGMSVYRHLGGDQWRLESDQGPCATTEVQWPTFPCNTETIQLARGVHGSGGDPVLLARDSRPGYGIQLARYSTAERRWIHTAQKPNPWHEAHHSQRPYLATIQVADVDGDGADEVFGRARGGFALFQLGFRSDGLIGWGAPRSLNKPLLSGEPWDLARHFTTIETAQLGPGKARSLVARGPRGMRAWAYDRAANAFARPRPYGVFPKLDANALDAVDSFLGFARGSVRDLLTDPSRDPSAERLANLQAALAGTCAGPDSAVPPSYRSCTPPAGAGVAAAAWTKAANTVVAELFWARQVIDHFQTLEAVQGRLFVDQAGALPSIAADLKLASTPGVRFEIDVEGLVGSIVEIAVAAGVPGVSTGVGATALAFGLVSSLIPRAVGEQPSGFELKLAELNKFTAMMREEIRDSITRQRRYVLADPGLSATVGRLVASGVWEIDRQALVSAGRRAFVGSIYQGLLPTLWDRWLVERCTYGVGSTSCHGPATGPLSWREFKYPTQQTYDFGALVPKQEPCDRDFRIGGNRNCDWRSLEQGGYGEVVKLLLDPVGADCRYDPVRGTSWQFGCSLGLDRKALMDPPPSSPWQFRTRRCTYPLYNQPAKSCHVAQE